MKIKPCKLCSQKRYANLNWCYKHYRERERLKKEEKAKRKKERKEQSKGFQESLRKILHKKAWSLMSEYVRRLDTNPDGFGECYTCNSQIHWKNANAGHFKHDRLDFDLRNIKRQCVTCNKYYSGRLDVYASRLIRENGWEWFQELEIDAWKSHKYDTLELKQIIEDLTIKISKL